MQIRIRKFEQFDIESKVKWINDPRNNQYLHYDLPLEVEKTRNWYESIKARKDRYDAVIEADGVPCGLIGLLNIDSKNRKAEYYISMGEVEYKGKGVAGAASRLILEYAFNELQLNRVYLYTEVDNIPAQRLFQKVGFREEGKLHNHLYSHGKFVDSYIYGFCRNDYADTTEKRVASVPIYQIGYLDSNQLYIMREDLIPYSFGGNKARKAQLFFKEIDEGKYSCVVTYGSGSSNHCRVVANMAAQRELPCYIISPEETNKVTYNGEMMRLFGAKITMCPVHEVHDTIEAKLAELTEQGQKPYFIAGGGHGVTGTQAYVDCFEEISDFAQKNGVHFDYIFHASGTGTTQAGLICGKLMRKDTGKIIGISIARPKAYGRQVVLDSIFDYFNQKDIPVQDSDVENATIFEDAYTGKGYGSNNEEILKTIKEMMISYGIPLDSTYTGKAFLGMKEYLKKNNIEGQKVLFVHTGGTPLFFDDLQGRG